MGKFGRRELSFVLFVACCAVPAVLHLSLVLFWSAVGRDGGTARARRISGVFIFWNRVWLLIARVVGGIRCDFVFEGEAYDHAVHGPATVVANHCGAFDVPLMCELAARCGVSDFRGVVMHEAAPWPLLGWVMRAARFCFVRRGRDPRDREALAAFTRDLREDGATAVILPEGKNFRGPDGAYTNVSRPRTGGLKAILEATPNRPVVVAAIRWHDRDLASHGWIRVTGPGTRVTVTVRLCHGVTASNADAFIAGEWRRMDARLGANEDAN